MAVKRDVGRVSIAGGTDPAGAFLAGLPALPVRGRDAVPCAGARGRGVRRQRCAGARRGRRTGLQRAVSVAAALLPERPRRPSLDDLHARIAARIRDALSARHVPEEIIAIAEVPRTLSGRKTELPVKRLLLLGYPVEKVANADAMANPACLGGFVEFARRRRAAP